MGGYNLPVRRLGRYIFNALTVLSLLLCVATVGLWVRSYWRSYFFRFVNGDARVMRGIDLVKGRVELEIVHGNLVTYFRDIQSGYRYKSGAAYESPKLPHTFLLLGLGSSADALPSTVRWTQISIPDAYVLALFLTLPSIRLYPRLRRRQVMLPGCCFSCGYDLRATPDRCPECGSVRAKVKT